MFFILFNFCVFLDRSLGLRPGMRDLHLLGGIDVKLAGAQEPKLEITSKHNRVSDDGFLIVRMD